MEIMRQAGFYMDPATQQIFKGAPYYCEKKLFGLSNCCNTDGGGAGMNNSSLVAKAGGSALKFGAEYIKNVGSPYMFDMMYSSDMPWLVDMAYEAMWGSTWASTGTVELYGLTFEITGGLGYSSVTLVGFDPTSLAISLAVMVVMDMLACTNDEKLLALKRGQNLCVYAGDQCTSKFLGACVTRQQTYCCYNSRLGKLVATGAGAQLGRPPSSGNCAGFTAGDLQKVDFSKIDFSEFIAEIAPTSKSAAYATQRGQDKMQSYFAP
jgi:conjugal transfer mating pair stabilization protein TraN